MVSLDDALDGMIESSPFDSRKRAQCAGDTDEEMDNIGEEESIDSDEAVEFPAEQSSDDEADEEYADDQRLSLLRRENRLHSAWAEQIFMVAASAPHRQGRGVGGPVETATHIC